MNKKWNIVYWITTVIFSLFTIFGAYTEVARWPQGIELMQHLGYPIYFLTLLGVAKFLGVIGIWQKFSPSLREWAYAGFSIDLISAVISTAAVHDPFSAMVPALINIVILGLSYVALKKRMGMKVF